MRTEFIHEKKAEVNGIYDTYDDDYSVISDVATSFFKGSVRQSSNSMMIGGCK